MQPYPARSSEDPRRAGITQRKKHPNEPPGAGKRPRPPKTREGTPERRGGRPAALVGGIGGASPPPAHAARRRHAPDRRARAVGRSPPEAKVDGRREHPRRDGPMTDRNLGAATGAAPEIGCDGSTIVRNAVAVARLCGQMPAKKGKRRDAGKPRQCGRDSGRCRGFFLYLIL